MNEISNFVLNWFQSLTTNNNAWITDIPILHFTIFHPHSIVISVHSFIHSSIHQSNHPSKHLHQPTNTHSKIILQENINVWSMARSMFEATSKYIIALQSLTKKHWRFHETKNQLTIFTISFKFVFIWLLLQLLLQLLSVIFMNEPNINVLKQQNRCLLNGVPLPYETAQMAPMII